MLSRNEMLSSKPRTDSYQKTLRYIFSAQFAKAKADLMNLSSGHGDSERKELLSLIEFQTGTHREGPQLEWWSNWLVRFCRHHRFISNVFFGILRVFGFCLKLIGLDRDVFDRLNRKWAPEIIHYRYTNFASGLFKTWILSVLASKKSRNLERVYFIGLRGHFECMTGNFASGLHSFEFAYNILRNEHQKINGDSLNNPQVFHYYAEILGIQALQLSYGGYLDESGKQYVEIANLLSKFPYFYVEIFCFSMKMYLALEQLDAEAMQKTAQRLKTILGEHFSGKFGLRTSAYSALLSSIRRDYVSAREQVLTSESFYSHTESAVELGRYHFLRALVELEFGNVEGAVQNSQRAISFLTPIPGADYQTAASILLDVEVRLRIFLLQSDKSNRISEVNELEKILHQTSKKIVGAPGVQSRTLVLKALCAFLKGEYQLASNMTKIYKEKYQGKFPRLEYILSQFDSTMMGIKSIPADSFHTESRTVASLIDEIIKFIAADDFQAASANILRVILSAAECKVSTDELSSESNVPYEITQQSSSAVEIKMFLMNRIIKFEIINPLNNIQFDERVMKSLKLVLSIIHAGFQRQNLIDSQRMAEIGQLATQVSHDIKSPLAALDMVVSDLSELSEDKRILVRSAVGRIKDITNNLLQKNCEVIADQNSSRNQRRGYFEPKSPQLLSSFVESIISEKRAQFIDKPNIEIIFVNATASYGLFAEIQPTEFKRLLSNLLDNGIESLNDSGTVKIMLSANEFGVELKIIDNGRGIPSEILSKLGQRGTTYGKTGGSGLGIFHARKSCEAVGGTLQIESEVGKGTSVIISLPRTNPPSWFVPELKFRANSTVMILDDDFSVKEIWRQRFEQLKIKDHQIDSKYFSSSEELEKGFEVLDKSKQVVYLLDYEIIGDRKNGLDVVEQLGIGHQSILVSSHWDERAIQERCIKLNVRLIPKGLAGFVPIAIN